LIRPPKCEIIRFPTRKEETTHDVAQDRHRLNLYVTADRAERRHSSVQYRAALARRCAGMKSQDLLKNPDFTAAVKAIAGTWRLNLDLAK
jgi:hypothetical protein